MERIIERFDMYMEYKGLNHLHISGYRLQKQFGYVYDDLEAEKEILELKMEISRIKEFLGMK